jgi:hypothetical protein
MLEKSEWACMTRMGEYVRLNERLCLRKVSGHVRLEWASMCG